MKSSPEIAQIQSNTIQKVHPMKMFQILIAFAAIALFAGCSLNIESMPVDQTEFDNAEIAIYREMMGDPEHYPRLVIVAEQGDADYDIRNVQTMFGACLDTAFSTLPYFETVARAELGALKAETQIVNLSQAENNAVAVNQADYLITYRLLAAKTASESKKEYYGNGSYQMVAYYTSTLKCRISVLHISTGKRAYSEIFEVSDSTGRDRNENWDALSEQLASKVTRDFYSRYGIPVYVEETRGNGRIALLSDNFLTRNLSVGSKVKFIAPGSPSGTVYQGRWVEVDNYEQAGVMKNQLCELL